MLVLSRKKGEVIRVNDDISIYVVDIRGDKVRLGVEAPKDTPVHRGEVYDAIHKTTHTIPRASLPPEHKQMDADATTAEAMERQEPLDKEDGAAA